MTCFITFPGDPSDPGTFGGTPYHLLKAMRAVGVPAEGLALRPPITNQALRLVWNSMNLAFHNEYGGFQYSDLYLRSIWRNAPDFTSDDIIINIFQLYGEDVLQSPAHKIFYLDMTLRQLFDDYQIRVSRGAQDIALEKERAGYNAASLIICRSEWAAESVIRDYGIAREKVKSVISGANVSSTMERMLLSAPARDANQVLRFIFVGKDPVRKGLLRFLEAVRLLGDCADKLELHVVGLRESDIPAEYLGACATTFHGVIDKGAEEKRFCDLLLGSDVGILLSTAEAGGISLREFQLAGLAVIAPRVGGSPEWVDANSCILIDRDDDATTIAARVRELVQDRGKIDTMRASARAHRARATWTFAASQIRSYLEAIPAAVPAAA